MSHSFFYLNFLLFLSCVANAQTPFPSYIDTGNPNLDASEYQRQKEAWIATNPEAYAKMNSPNEKVLPNNPTVVEQPIQQEAILSAPHYPSMQVGRDEMNDEKKHIASKIEWIKNHPEEYRAVGGNPEELINQQKNDETVHNNQQVSILPAFNSSKKYLLKKVEAVSAIGKTNTSAEKKEETAKMKEEFPENITELQVNHNQQIRLYVPEKMDYRAVETRNNTDVSWFFENKECETCSKTLLLTIEKETDTQLTYLLQSEDDNSPFAYRLSFQLIVKP